MSLRLAHARQALPPVAFLACLACPRSPWHAHLSLRGTHFFAPSRLAVLRCGADQRACPSIPVPANPRCNTMVCTSHAQRTGRVVACASPRAAGRARAVCAKNSLSGSIGWSLLRTACPLSRNVGPTPCPPRSRSPAPSTHAAGVVVGWGVDVDVWRGPPLTRVAFRCLCHDGKGVPISGGRRVR